MSTVGFGMFSLLDSNEKRRETQLPPWAPDWVSSSNPKFARLSDCLRTRSSSRNLVWASQSRVVVYGARFMGEVQELESIIDQSFNPQIAKDFFELAHRHWLSDQDLWRFVKKSFEETYRQWRHVLGRLIPDPGRLGREFERQFGIDVDEKGEMDLWDNLYHSKWPDDSKLNPQECLIARDIKSTIAALSNLKGTRSRDAVDLRPLCTDPWYDISNSFK